MSELTIHIEGDKTSFLPGEEVTGTVSWQLSEPAEQISLNLLWHTSGKGDSDAEITETVNFASPSNKDSRPFRLRLPDSPYSFSGKLISLGWALEILVEPSEESMRLDIIVSPSGKEIILQGMP